MAVLSRNSEKRSRGFANVFARFDIVLVAPARGNKHSLRDWKAAQPSISRDRVHRRNRNLPQILPSRKKRQRSTWSASIITEEFDTYDTRRVVTERYFSAAVKRSRTKEEKRKRKSKSLGLLRCLFTDGRAADECVQIFLTTPSEK